ncbi:uncharacterized protein AMSG_00272 [Thecamonas trahens ATCC 50062]|uniref:HEAT repeat domain-containing protein n=1 Tax=Thecamonas trahens ATCC 50062 TaxID=461836 RepID=A0A0L0D1C2_THETB|nr:hypothetical protein AMSG_00272 [Thecamonas trahens ATCC 50062]KNC46154.1 hypothetical protein AMSG_00272 [Thecamonas trahens ATCC 50062]|eukprot:XP_013763130.1 hypothetical protein AMSG_00272 [Thecamonas trahens ATCC 50062]
MEVSLDLASDVFSHVLSRAPPAEAGLMEALAVLIAEAADEPSVPADWMDAFSELLADAGVDEDTAVAAAAEFVLRAAQASVAAASCARAESQPAASIAIADSSHPYALACVDSVSGKPLSLGEVNDRVAEASGSCAVSLEVFMEGTRAVDARERRLALRELCPCHVKKDIDVFWKRIMAMVNDPDPDVRYQVLHNLCDGSPLRLEADVIAAIEILHNDADKRVARAARRVLVEYRKTGDWNVM